MTQETTIKPRVKLSLVNALLVFIPYAIILVGLQKAAGVSLTEVSKSTQNLIDFALIPVAAGSMFLIIAGLVTGWLGLVWKDRLKLDKPTWLKYFAIVIVGYIVVNFIGSNIFSLDSNFILTAMVATILVGFSEELMFRGYLLQSARGDGYSEKKVMLITAIMFGLFHGVNIFTGAAVATVVPQMFNAAILGAALYVVFRKSGLLLVPIILHFLQDFSIFTKGEDLSAVKGLISLMALTLPLVILVMVVKAWKYIDTKDVQLKGANANG